MKVGRKNFIYGALYVFFVLFVVADVSAEVEIREIKITGNERVDEETIRLQLHSQVGDTLNSKDIESDIKDIYRTGYFIKVRAKLEKSNNGTLIYEVIERPSIRNVKLTGNKEIDTDALKEQLAVGTRRFLDKKRVKAAVDQALAFYRDKGFYGAEIDYTISPIDGSNQVDITFFITEGKKKVVREIVFEGNDSFDSDDLEDVVTVDTYSWWTSWITSAGTIKEGQLENDVRLLTQHYLKNGRVDIQIADPVTEETEDGLKVTFKISEGDIFYFGEITATGTLFEENEAKTLEGIDSKPGDVFNVETFRNDAFIISEKFTDIGYAFANVEPITTINRDEHKVDLSFQIDKGGIVHINRITFSGNEKTSDNVIRRSLYIQERELFSSSQIKRSQELIQRLGYFDEVSITTNPTDSKDELDLSVAVREGSTGSFSAGAGVSSGDGFIVSFRISENNIFGTGNGVNLDINTGSRRENYLLSFNNPRVNDTRWSFGVSLLSVERVFDDFDRNQAGGSIKFGYPLWFLGKEYLDDIQFGLAYEYLRIKIDEVEPNAPQLVKDEEGETTASSITPSIRRNTVDNPLDPTTGSKQTLSVELAGIGAEEEFWLVNVSNTFFYPVYEFSFGPLVFSHRVRFGYGDTFNNTNFPLYRRFFPGGINSVRGYDSRELGPKDSEGNEFGGSKQFVTNFELIFPIIPSAGLKGVVFYDTGDAFDDGENIQFGELRQAIGWGIRWRSPLAPIRIELGYPLDKEEGDKSLVTNFSFGAPL